VNKRLVVNQVTSGYHRPVAAIRDIELSVERGQIVTVLGSNGAGKTTLLRAMSGLLRPWAGTVLLDDRALRHTDAHAIVKAGISHVPEGRRIFPGLTVRENLELGGFTLPRQAFADQLQEVLSLFPRLGERLAQGGATLSGGEQQMLAIARALMSRPSFLLLDEPSMGLAPIMVQRTYRYIQEIRRNDVGILLVEQNARMALEIADYGYVLDNGSVTVSGAADELANDERVIDAYLTA
jgi:branched-chain amino acid transport system ATP-binding protein